MTIPTDEQVAAWLTGIVADGFNRSLAALEHAGAIDTRKMRRRYTGTGSKYYDLAIKAASKTAGWSAPSFSELLGAKIPSDKEVAAWLIGIIADGFNRSMGALEDAGAIDIRKMRQHYKGMGSKYYDQVTKAIYKTAGCSAPSFRKLLAGN